MTRTAADVQADIDALQADDLARLRTYCDVELVAGVAGQRHSPKHWLWEATEYEALKGRYDRLDALKVEYARLLREELDAATPTKTRAAAVTLRQAYFDAGGTGIVAPWSDMTWDALGTEQAKAWAAVAREAGR